MQTDLSDDELTLLVRALEHYSAYLRAVQREDSRYQLLAEKLQRKPVQSERAQAALKKKRA